MWLVICSNMPGHFDNQRIITYALDTTVTVALL